MFCVSSGKTETRWHQTAQKSESIAKQWLIHRCSHWPPCSNSPFLNDPIQLMTPIHQWLIQEIAGAEVSASMWLLSKLSMPSAVKSSNANMLTNCTKTMSITWKKLNQCRFPLSWTAMIFFQELYHYRISDTYRNSWWLLNCSLNTYSIHLVVIIEGPQLVRTHSSIYSLASSMHKLHAKDW